VFLQRRQKRFAPLFVAPHQPHWFAFCKRDEVLAEVCGPETAQEAESAL
jgi:hypothetical protein